MFIFKLGVIIWGGVGVINYLIEINIKKIILDILCY